METKKAWIGGVAVIILLTLAHSAYAATLYFSPPSGSLEVGQNISVSVYVSSADQAMNAAEGTISFPIDKLSVVSLSRTGSIATLWVQPPSFSNKDGIINFQGVTVNPGFQGAAGKMITIVFRAKQTGSAPLVFTTGSVLANDGEGTNILSQLNSAAYTITPATIPATTTAPTASSTDSSSTPEIELPVEQLPVVSSSTSTNTPAVVTSNNWFPNIITLLFEWATIIIAAVFLTTIIAGIIYYLHYLVRYWTISLRTKLLRHERELQEEWEKHKGKR